MCQSANRSQFIKNKYFSDYERIKVNKNLQFSTLKHGLNNVLGIKINIIGSNSFNFYSIMRITQTIMGIIMLSVGIYISKEKKIIVPWIILVAFGSMTLFNGLTSCSMSILLEDYLN